MVVGGLSMVGRGIETGIGAEGVATMREQVTYQEALRDVTDNGIGCMDERPRVALLQQQPDGTLVVLAKGEAATEKVMVKIPGGALGLIKVVQDFGGVSLDEAFEIVEEACKIAEFTPKVHIDDHHGHVDVENMDDTSIAAFVRENAAGCGFSVLAWGEQAGAVVRKAIERGWLVGILHGDHGATRAVRVTQQGKAISRAAASADVFSYNQPETHKLLETINNRLQKATFVQDAAKWIDEIFEAVAKKLGDGITDIDTV